MDPEEKDASQLEPSDLVALKPADIENLSPEERAALIPVGPAEFSGDKIVTADAPPNDPFEALLGVPDAVLLVCPVALKNLNLVDVPGTVITVSAAIEVRFAPGFTVTTARENLKIIV